MVAYAYAYAAQFPSETEKLAVIGDTGACREQPKFAFGSSKYFDTKHCARDAQ
jgi:hypothetical protein